MSENPYEEDTQTLQRALDLYRGEFLAGFSVRNAPNFDEWVVSQRQEWRALALHGLYRLAERYLQQGNMSACLVAIHRLLLEEPLHEAGYCLHMKLLAATGQRGVAIELYHKLRKILHNARQITPEPEKIALYDLLIQCNYSVSMTR